MAQASSSASFVDSIGINTSITLIGSAYQNYAQMMNALSYIAVTNIRDTYDNPYTIAEFAQMANQLHLKFDFFTALGGVSPEWQLAQIKANPSIVSYVEGYNESDSWWQSFHGTTGVAATQAEQAFLYNAVKSDPTLSGIGVIQATFALPNSFAAYGDNSASADYASTHTYWGSGNNPIGSEASIIALAQTATPGKPTITTETGYHTTLGNVHGVSQLVQAKYEMDLLFEQAQAGVKLTYLWELADNYADPANANSEDHFGLFNNDWTPKLAAVALHNTMQIMADSRDGLVSPGALNYSLGSLPSSVQTALYQKSDGTFVLVVWNDVRLSGPTVQADILVAPIATTLQLGQQFSHISIFDPLTGTSSIQDVVNASSINLQVVDHPLIVELSQSPAFHPVNTTIVAPDQIITNPLQSVQVDDLAIASGLGTIAVQLQSAGSGLSILDTTGHLLAAQSNTITVTGSLSTINTELATVTYTGGSAVGQDVITVTTTDQSGTSSTRNVAVLVEAGTTAIDSGGAAVSVPLSFSSLTGATSLLPRFSVADTYASTHLGNVTLTVQAAAGTLQIPSAIGSVSGNQSSSLSLSGTFSQVVAALGALSYTAPGQATQDNITVTVTDQAGFSSTGTSVVTVSAIPATIPTVVAPITTTPATSDVTPPSLTVAQSVSGLTTSTSNTLSGTATDTGSGVAAVEIFLTTAGRSTDLGQATLTGGSWSYTANNLSPGTFSFLAVGFDRVGNTTAPISTGLSETVVAASRAISPPRLTVAQSVSGLTTSTSNTLSGTVTDTGSGVAAVEIFLTTAGRSTDLGQATLTGGSWSYTANNLSPGTYSFFAVGFDRAGNTNSPISTGPSETVIAALHPSVNTIVGNSDGGITLVGTSDPNSSVTITDSIGGITAVVGTTNSTTAGTWSLTSHAKVNMATINSFGASASAASGSFGSMIGQLYLGSTQPETLTGTAGTTDVFAIMSFSGADVISGFQSAKAVGAAHDVIDLSGRGISSYSQVQSMVSGTSSAIIGIGSGKTITLTNVSPNLLTAADFSFS